MAFLLSHKKVLLFFALLFGIGIFVRFEDLSRYPVSLSIDEIGFGYSAYSILRTGKDEFGASYPLAFQALGDYKPAVDVYLTSVSVALFGLNEMAVRLPIAIAGFLTIPVLILLLKELRFSVTASFAGGIWLLFSPWHIFFSRANYEAVLSLLFLLLGLYLFLLWTRKLSVSYFCLSIVLFSLSVWSYNAERLFAPLLVVFLLIMFRKQFKVFLTKPQNLILPICTFAFFSLPFAYLLLFTNLIKARAVELWLTHDPYLARQLHTGNYQNLGQFIFDNDLFLVARYWIGQYLNYFDLRIWFWKGIELTPKNYPDMGMLYVVEIPLFCLGIYRFTKTKNTFFKKLLVFWFFMGPLPASFTRGDPSSVRALLWLPLFGFIITLGIDQILKTRRWFLVVYTLLVFVNVMYFRDIYKYGFGNLYADIWHYGYKEAAVYACENRDKYNQIIITDLYGINGPLVKTVPHLYALFHCQYDPKMYLQDRKIYNISFRRPIRGVDTKLKNSLLIGSAYDFFEEFPEKSIVKRTYFPNGKPAFVFVETGK